MKYLSVCSGIEAASAAWHALEWEPVGFSEIEPFPIAVLAHRFPTIPNFGDITKYKEWPIAAESFQLLVGGTPCQSFSVAGLRKGLDDPRGNLMLVFGAIADHYKPTWIVWENVPGVLSSNGGRDFGSFIGMLGELGYGVAYRVLDAQYFGVAQRRRRVFVVGYLGDWRRAAAVLFEFESLSGHPAPSRETGKDIAVGVAQGTPVSDYEVAGTLDKGIPERGIGHNGNYDSQVVSVYYESHPADSRITGPHDVGNTVSARYGTGGGNTPLVSTWPAEVTATLNASFGDKQGLEDQHALNGASWFVPTAFHPTQDPIFSENVAHAMGTGSKGGQASVAVQTSTQVRRLTPTECERLQGFPDDWTLVPWRGKDAPDGPRYKALGNLMAVPVMRWIGERIQGVQDATLATASPQPRLD